MKRKSSLSMVVGLLLIFYSIIAVIYLYLNNVGFTGFWDTIGWVSSSVLGVMGGVFLYLWVTGNAYEEELKDRYKLFDGVVLCQSIGLAKHRCVVTGIKSAEPSGLISVIANYLKKRAGYTVRDLMKTYAILTRGGLFSGRKSVTLLVYQDKDKLIFEYRVAPLQASGLYDLKDLVSEVKALFDECSELRELIKWKGVPYTA